MGGTCRPPIEVPAEVPDFRRRRGRRHPLVAIPAPAGTAMLFGFRSVSAGVERGRTYGPELLGAPGFTRAAGCGAAARPWTRRPTTTSRRRRPAPSAAAAPAGAEAAQAAPGAGADAGLRRGVSDGLDPAAAPGPRLPADRRAQLPRAAAGPASARRGPGRGRVRAVSRWGHADVRGNRHRNGGRQGVGHLRGVATAGTTEVEMIEGMRTATRQHADCAVFAWPLLIALFLLALPCVSCAAARRSQANTAPRNTASSFARH
jgi:hypothetical protein